MKKICIALALIAFSVKASAQNPGLVISEFLANPPGTDNAFEWVELVATKSIDFSVTPYSVVVSNNGTATSNGWVSGGTLTYGFNINSGSVNAGDVVYVGGSTMLPTGTKLRTINVVSTAGDGFGTAAAGVFGNGGANADGIAVFNLPVSSLTNSSVPVDAIFYGTGIGTALVSSGAAGYQLPVNDRYAGGKLQSNSFFAGDPGSDVTIRATGYYNVATNNWFGQRTWTTQSTVNDNATAIQLVTANPPGTASISAVSQTVSETAGTVNVNVTFANANTSDAKIAFGLSAYSNATVNSDFSWTSDTLVIPASTNGTFAFPIQLTNDMLSERTERIIVKITGTVNATLSGNAFQIIYLTDDDYQAPAPSNELKLSLLNSFSNGAEGTNSAEIVAYDSSLYRLYIANSVGAKLDVVDFSNPSAPSLLSSVSMTPYGNINSLTVHNGVVAAAVENTNPQANGFVVFFDGSGNFLNKVTVGAMPDMITFNQDHSKIVVACEGEPKTDYSTDPEGSVAIVNLAPGIAALTDSDVSIAGFTAWNGQESTLRSLGIRIFGPGSSAAQDFEPEYITISEDNQTAYVTLQENNAMAVVDLNTATVTAIRPLGLSDYSTNNGMDASDQTSGIYISSIPVKGAYMPDALAHATIGGQEYLFTANEGDAREYTAVTDVARLSATSLDSTAFPDQQILKNNQFLGRLNVLQATGDTDGDGDKDEIHTLGSRSFSIWNAATGALVFDSKDLLEQITASNPAAAGLFNASNTSGTAVAKNRSDDKGPEPEGVATAYINGNHYLFVSLERIGGVALFNVDNPAQPVYAGYYNNRSAATNGPDRGAEGIIYIPESASPNQHAIVILANEVSSTLSIFQVNTCTELAGATITSVDDTICEGNSTVLTIPGNAQSSVQWFRNNSPLNGETGNSLTVSQSGDYRVFVTSTSEACADTTVATAITVKSLPVVHAGSDISLCEGMTATLTASGTNNYIWNNGITNSVAFTPANSAQYIVTGTDANGCQQNDTVQVTVHSLPLVDAGSDITICAGSTITLGVSGTASYNWNNGITNGIPFTPANSSAYIVTGTDANGCQQNDTVNVTVYTLPQVQAGADIDVCVGTSVTLTATGTDTYNWNNGITNSTPFTPANSSVYVVTGTDANGCTQNDTVMVNVHELPQVQAGIDINICAGVSIALDATGAADYSWNNGITNGVTFTPATSGQYVVTGTDANGCQQNDTVEVTVFPLPAINAGADIAICSGDSVILNATGAAGLEWSNGIVNGDAFVPESTLSLSVTGTDSFGCSASDQLTVTVNALPQVNLGDDTTICTNQAPLTVTAPSGFTAYSWNNGSSATSVSVTQTGVYSVVVTDANGCQESDAIAVTVDPCLGIDEQTTTTLQVFPNPVSDVLHITSTSSEPVTATIVSSEGVLVDTFTGLTTDMQNLAPGVYFVTVQQGSVSQVFRVEKIRK